MCFVDLENAFDCVPCGILSEVLWEYGVHGPLLRAVRSLYEWSRSLVRIASYDVVLLAPSSQNLQHALGRFAAECEAAGMRVSTSKSEAMVLDWKKVACTLQVGGEFLPQVEEFKYLWILFRSEGRMDRISRDNWHKRRKTGGKRKPVHKKRKYELGRPPSNTKLGPKRIHTVRVRGGNKKYRALRLDVGNFSWGSECCTRKTRIIDVVYNASNNELVRTKTLVKNCVVLVDSAPFRQWYESHYALPLGRKKGAKLTPEEEDILNKKRSKKVQKKFDKRRKNSKISPLLDEQFQQGKLLACLSSRPGQCGRADGYVLEGKELEFYLRKIKAKKGK
ncbi:hypothetical protein QTP70_008768 [Hemibagrus guttatus]|uniref:40S ribosomal protein S8 n=1 Tax=Hemibagrus guttatus TaxID=175788 RepID=A0AAE0V254_9TELE|nr:hypothetical protein QTP70_008768 [Hemibagrus guttatus]